MADQFDIISVDQLDDITLALNQYFSIANIYGRLFKAKVGDVAAFIAPFVSAVGASGLVFPDANNVLPNPVNGVVKGSIIGAGTFTWSGGSLTTVGLLNVIATNGTAWVLVKAIDTSAFLSKTEYNFGGSFATIAAANTAITNVVVNGKNLRDGKRVDIGTAGNYITYWWNGGFADTNLVPYNNGYVAFKDGVHLKGEKVTFLGKLYEANSDTIAGELPGTSAKWNEVLSSYVSATPSGNIKFTWTEGFAFASGGVPVADATSMISDYTEYPFPTLFTQYVRRVAFYRADKTFISQPAQNTSTAITEVIKPAGAVYIRVGALIISKDILWVGEKNQSIPSSFTFSKGSEKLPISVLPIPNFMADVYQTGQEVITPNNEIAKAIRKTTTTDTTTTVGAFMKLGLDTSNVYNIEDYYY